eukprot:g60155.t1
MLSIWGRAVPGGVPLSAQAAQWLRQGVSHSTGGIRHKLLARCLGQEQQATRHTRYTACGRLWSCLGHHRQQTPNSQTSAAGWRGSRSVSTAASSAAAAVSRSEAAAPSAVTPDNSTHPFLSPPTESTISSMTISDIVNEASDLLPTQAILENFVHTNPYQRFEHMDFNEVLTYVHNLEKYMSPSERVFALVKVDPRHRMNNAVVDLSGVFLDRGAAKWKPPYRHRGFLYFFASLEGLGCARWRKYSRQVARRVLAELNAPDADSVAVAENIIKENLIFMGIPKEEWIFAVRSMLLNTRGWAGMFKRMQDFPAEAPPNTLVRLLDFAAVQSILARASSTALAKQFGGWNPKAMSFAEWLKPAGTWRGADEETALHPSAIAWIDQNTERRESLENEFLHTLLRAIGTKHIPPDLNTHRPALQLYMCIDDREGSFRRHVEAAHPTDIETFGVAGFFGLPIRYRSLEGSVDILAPLGNNPQAVLSESDIPQEHDQAMEYQKRRRMLANLAVNYENASFDAVGSLALSLLAPVSLARLFLMGYAPNLNRNLRKSILQPLLQKPHTDFPSPYRPEVAAKMLASTFKDIGTDHRFAPICIVLGHGSLSTNNPFSAAYNCGACGGREGGPNARLMARLANTPEVRSILFNEYGIQIPDDTVFIGGLHNTTTDAVTYFDTEGLSEYHQELFTAAQDIIDHARGLNALERCQRFLLAQKVHTPHEALWETETRSLDAAEVRPELNHATNAAVVVGRRELTKGRHLDRRVFLASYDPYTDDDHGTNLEHVLAPALVVCSGINLEYFFSTAEPDHHGAGTKAPLNITGNLGVLQGTQGDLRPGLPTQMTEMHTPIRAHYVVDAPVHRVEAVFARRPDLHNLVRNEWVRFVVRDPSSNRFMLQSKGEYKPIVPERTSNPYSYVSSRLQSEHGVEIAKREDLIYWAASAGLILSGVLPCCAFGLEGAMNPRGPLIAAAGTLLSLPILAFARRYLHGEFMFGRFSVLSVGLATGFNLVAMAPNLEIALAGWSLFGFSSTFLIGAYNERSSVRYNATFAFAAYQLSDMALLVACTYAPIISQHPGLVAGSLCFAALLKSSQFPITALFVRSMEGPTPASALGYAGLSAHAGVVLLTSTMPLWYNVEGARMALASVGLITAITSKLLSKVRADRKGAIADATSSTLGMIFFILSLGYTDTALFLSLGHAAFRMIQILRAPNVIADSQQMRLALGGEYPWPKVVSNFAYHVSWALHRFKTDVHLLHLLRLLSRLTPVRKPLKLSKVQQWAATGCILSLAGLPLTPLAYWKEELLMELLLHEPYLAAGLMAAHFGASVLMIRFLLKHILHRRRFQYLPDSPRNATSAHKSPSSIAHASPSPSMAKPSPANLVLWLPEWEMPRLAAAAAASV